MIKAIPTHYNGTKFRSMLEARYAKLLDGLGIRWSYEVQGYQYGGVRYLPDFYLPEMNVLLEVKGPTIPGVEKPTNLRKLIESGVVAPVDWWNPEVLIIVGEADGRITAAGSDETAVLAKCTECGRYFFLYSARSFECRLCHAWDGDHYIAEWHERLDLPQIELFQ